MIYDFKKSIIEYNVIVPTHRPLFLKQCLESILNQKVKPDRVIVILDNTLKNVDEAFQIISSFEQTLFPLYVVHSETTGALNAFKNCFKTMEMFSGSIQLNTKRYFHIMEDDCKYVSNYMVKYIKEILEKENIDFFYLPIIDYVVKEDKFKEDIKIDRSTSWLVKNKMPSSNKNPRQTEESLILDTCSMVFEITSIDQQNRLSNFNKIIKHLGYVLNADMYAYRYFIMGSKNPKRSNRHCVISYIHPDQISANLGAQVMDSQIEWIKAFRKFNGVITKQLKYEARLMQLFNIKALIKFFNINLENIKPKKPTKDFITWYYGCQNLPGEVPSLTSIPYFKSGISYFIKELKWISEIEINEKDMDYSPYLKLD